MELGIKKIKNNRLDRFGSLSQKNEFEKPRVMNLVDSHNKNHDIQSISNKGNNKLVIEIEHLKSNGIIYSNILNFR